MDIMGAVVDYIKLYLDDRLIIHRLLVLEGVNRQSIIVITAANSGVLMKHSFVHCSIHVLDGSVDFIFADHSCQRFVDLSCQRFDMCNPELVHMIETKLDDWFPASKYPRST